MMCRARTCRGLRRGFTRRPRCAQRVEANLAGDPSTRSRRSPGHPGSSPSWNALAALTTTVLVEVFFASSDLVLLGTRQLEVALAVLEVRDLLGVVRVAEVRVARHLLVDVAGQVKPSPPERAIVTIAVSPKAVALESRPSSTCPVWAREATSRPSKHADLGALAAVGRCTGSSAHRSW